MNFLGNSVVQVRDDGDLEEGSFVGNERSDRF